MLASCITVPCLAISCEGLRSYNRRVYEILANLQRGSVVLDLGCGGGSFPAGGHTVIRVDHTLSAPKADGIFVCGDAAILPVKSSSLDAVVCHHSLEHFSELDAVLEEIGRTVKPQGALFVSVPDASTLTDVVYRWLSHGGGHVNAFRNSGDLIRRITAHTGLPHRATRPLFSSLSFLNRASRTAWPPRRLLLLGGGAEWSLRLYLLASRWADRWLRTRLSFYGWAMYFGAIGDSIDETGWCNVCIRCGSSSPSESLKSAGSVRRRWGMFRVYECPQCSTWNFFFDDKNFRHVR